MATDLAQLPSIELTQAAIESSLATLASLDEELVAAAAARKRLRDEARKKPDPALVLGQRDVDSLKRIKRQPPTAASHVVCAVCTLLMQQRRRRKRHFVLWDEAVSLLPRVDWFAFKAFDPSLLLLAPELMAVVQSRLAVSTPYRFDEGGDGSGADRVTAEHAKKASAVIGKLFAWCDRVIANAEEVRAAASEEDRRAAATVDGIEERKRAAAERLSGLKEHLCAQRTAQRTAAEESALIALVGQPVLSINLEEAREALQRATASGVDDAALKKAHAAIEGAEKAQRLRSSAAAAMSSMANAPLLALPTKDAHASIDRAVKAGVDSTLIDKARERAAAASTAQQQRDSAEKELARLGALPALKVSLGELTSAIESARAAGVDREWVAPAESKHAEAEKKQKARDVSISSLEGVLKAGPLELDVGRGTRELERARACGVTGELLKRGADLIAKAREAQDRRSALLQKLRRMEEVSPLALRVDAARATIEAARSAGVGEKDVEMAIALIDKAGEAQREQAATLEEVKRLASAAPLEMDVEAARKASEAAIAKGAQCDEQIRLIDAAAKKQQARRAAAVALERLLAMPPLDVSVKDAAGMVAASKAAEVEADLVSSAEQLIRKARESQSTRKESQRQLAETVAAAPLEMDIAAARNALDAAREAGVGEGALNEAKGKIDAAVAAQEARDAAAKRLDEATSRPPLEMDVPGAKAGALAAATAGVPKAAIQRGYRAIAAAEKAQVARRTTLEGIARLMASDLLDISLEPARALLETASGLGVGKDERDAAAARVEEAAVKQAARAAAKAVLNEALASPPLDLDVEAARRAVQAATEASVPEDALRRASKQLAAAEKAQRDRSEAQSKLSGLTEQPQLALALKEARSVLAAAKKAGVEAEQLDAASAHIDGAAKAQAARAEAAAALELALKAPPLKLDAAKAQAAIDIARDAGTAEDILGAAESRVAVATEAQSRRDSALETLRAHQETPPLDVDVPVAQADLKAAKGAGCDASELADASAHVKQAVSTQAKAGAARRELEQLSSAKSLDVDVSKSKAAIATARESGVGADALNAASLKVEEAEKAQAARDAASAQLKLLLEQKPLLIRRAEADQLVEDGRSAGVAEQLLGKASKCIKTAGAAQQSTLAELATLASTPLLDVEPARAKRCLEAARTVPDVDVTLLESASKTLNSAEEAIRARDKATAALRAALESEQLSADLNTLRASRDAAAAASVAKSLLNDADKFIQQAAARQAAKARADAAKAAVDAFSEVPPLTLRLEDAQAAIREGRAAGLDAAAIAPLEAKVKAAEKAMRERERLTEELKTLNEQDAVAVNVPALKEAIAAGQAAGVSDEVMQVSVGRVSLAEAVQAAAAVADQALERLLETPKEYVDVEEAKEEIAEMRSKGASAAMVNKAEMHVEEAAKAQRRLDEARQALQDVSTSEPLSLDVADGRKRLSEARAAGVEESLIGSASRHVETAVEAQAKRDAAWEQLVALAECPPGEMDVVQAQDVFRQAWQAGVDEDKLEAVVALVEKEAELQQKREDALVALEEVLDAAPLEIDLPSARFMLADAEANGVTATNLAAARATIEFAEKAQSQEREAPRGDEFPDGGGHGVHQGGYLGRLS